MTLPAIAQVRTREGLNHFLVIHKVLKNNRLNVLDVVIKLFILPNYTVPYLIIYSIFIIGN